MSRPSTELAHLFRQLKAPAAARALPKLADRARAEEWSFEQFAAALLKTEVDSANKNGESLSQEKSTLQTQNTELQARLASMQTHGNELDSKLKESEVESIAKMTTISDELLRLIANTRAWTKNYAVVLALTKNPKTPIAVSMNLLARLNDKDLRNLSTDRNIPDVLRITARKKVVIQK